MRDGPYRVEARTHQTEKLEDQSEERVLYNPWRPNEAVMFDSLPGSPVSDGRDGLAAKKPGRKPKLTEVERRNAELVKRNADLERKLHIANVLIELEKKAHEVLGLALPESDGDS